jgi:hypothetical protein
MRQGAKLVPGLKLVLTAFLLAGMPCAFLVQGSDAGDIGCGGFLRAPGRAGGAKPDLSPVRAKLINKGGVVKAETECAPNGYYFLPMYDAGAYVIKLEGPPGTERPRPGSRPVL